MSFNYQYAHSNYVIFGGNILQVTCITVSKITWYFAFFMGFVGKKQIITFVHHLPKIHGNLCILPVTVNMPTRLQCLDVPILDHQQCENAYPGMITRRMMCAGYLEGGRDSCNVS